MFTAAPFHKRCHESKNKSFLHINTQFFNEASTENNKGSAHVMVSPVILTTPPNSNTRPIPLTAMISHIDARPHTANISTTTTALTMSPQPFLSPAPSPSTSTSSTDSSVINASSTPTRSILRNKCQLMRPAPQPYQKQRSPAITTSSWESIQSPAASFLASFASPPTVVPNNSSNNSSFIVQQHEEEQEGDEIDDYVIDAIVGFGTFSTVRKGFRISDGRHIAIKIIKPDNTGEDISFLERELTIWKSLDHPNIVCLQKILETEHGFYLICDYCSGGNLLSKLKGAPQGLSESEARDIFLDICQAVSYLHEQAKICHKDLKLENILFDDDQHKRAKVCDFGLALPFGCCVNDALSLSKPATPGGSLAYMSPEQLKKSTDFTASICSPSSDIWSLGVILYAMATGKLPFWDEYDLRLQQKILIGQYDLPSHLSKALQALIRGCLTMNPDERWNIQQILACSWLNQ